MPRHSSPVPEKVQAVETRSHAVRRIHPLVLPGLQPIDITPWEFSCLQNSCSSLQALRYKASTVEEKVTRSEADTNFNFSLVEEGVTEPPDLLPVSPDGRKDVEEISFQYRLTAAKM
ncbi:hypothetical protein E2C01_042474 [Portunus trituberculatus]|uniref:Uncharacterized protein n=1 Tax=Portunus trituberculatus TaxID=210409 RepID=A0A5B7FQB7_PORTR|nr:hypothetical protein [Portunus trituberculatus]